MVDQQTLAPEEIEALLGAGEEEGKAVPSEKGLSQDEIKVISGVMGKAMEACGSVLSTTLGRKASITNPEIVVEAVEFLRESFPSPAIIVESEYIQGIRGETVIILPKNIGAIIADLMMGGDGSSPPEEINELYLGAVNEVLRQMMSAGVGTFATTLNKGVEMSSLRVNVVAPRDITLSLFKRDIVVRIVCRLSISGFEADSFIQLISFDLAKAIVAAYRESKGVHPVQFVPLGPGAPGAEGNIGLLTDVPVTGAVELGRTEMHIKDILSLGPGSIVELDREAGEPVDLLINGKLIAKGEVVVIDDDFGIKITEIISPAERISHI
ncbi:MAG: flagellar motor switch protein FliN [bacterium]